MSEMSKHVATHLHATVELGLTADHRAGEPLFRRPSSLVLLASSGLASDQGSGCTYIYNDQTQQGE